MRLRTAEDVEQFRKKLQRMFPRYDAACEIFDFGHKTGVCLSRNDNDYARTQVVAGHYPAPIDAAVVGGSLLRVLYPRGWAQS